MAKFDLEFKLRVVRAHQAGEGGARALSARFAVSRTVIAGWIARFELHGVAGLQKKRNAYSAEFKLSVLEHVQREGLSHTQATALYDLRGGPGVIAIWQRQYHQGGFEGLKPGPRGRPRKMKNSPPPIPQESRTASGADAQQPSGDEQRTLKQVLKENEYLRAEVAYLKKLRALIQEKDRAAQKKRG